MKRSSEGFPKSGGRLQRLAVAEQIAAHSAQVASSSNSSHADLEHLQDPKPSPLVAEFDSQLVVHLLHEWSWGHLSATKVQEFAHKAYTDQVNLLKSLKLSPDSAAQSLKKIASLGSFGKHKHNCHAELILYLGDAHTPTPFTHDVPMVLPKPQEGQEQIQIQKFPIFLPHVWFAHYYKDDRPNFDSLFLGNHATRQSRMNFWSELVKRKDPRLQGHAMTKDANWQEIFIPLALHGDGVPVFQIGKAATRSLDVCSFSSLFCTASSSLLSQMLLYMVFAMNADDGTETELWRILLWSFYWLYKGTWPEIDHNRKMAKWVC